MITDLFSHKIHSSAPEWPEKIIELAFIFSGFDGMPFDRDAIEQSLSAVSSRSSFAARDRSKFRDEVSAYQSYLGLYRLEVKDGRWYLFLSETAKRFLTREEPDIASFLRLQMTLFQFPNGMGGAYDSNSDRVRIQANSRDVTLGYVEQGIHYSPLRAIVSALYADAIMREVPLLEASITPAEIYAMANDSTVNQSALPELDDAINSLTNIRSGIIQPLNTFENRLHLLGHLGLFDVTPQAISVRQTFGDEDALQLRNQLEAIISIENQFDLFDSATNGSEIEEILQGGQWGIYFDGVSTLEGDIIADLTLEPWLDIPAAQPIMEREATAAPILAYPLRERELDIEVPPPYSRERELADPEVTRIKRQRANLEHKLILEKIDKLVRGLGATPQANEHIDLYAEIPNDGGFIFEIKSSGENLLSQIRKGLSQLYEYRFRYRESLHDTIHLCMVLPSLPTSIPWVIEYLCIDREICICWFDENETLQFPEECANEMGFLVAS